MTAMYEFLQGLPWYIAIIYVAGVIFQLAIIGGILMMFPEITRTLFTSGVLLIGYLMYAGSREGMSNVSVSIGVLLVLVIILFIMLCVMDDETEDCGILGTCFWNLYGGMRNLVLLALCCTVVLIPLAVSIWNSNDR